MVKFERTVLYLMCKAGELMGNFDRIYSELLEMLKMAEKRHRDDYGKASDNNEWTVAGSEISTAWQIFYWRSMLHAMWQDIKKAGVNFGEDTTSGSEIYTETDSKFEPELYMEIETNFESEPYTESETNYEPESNAKDHLTYELIESNPEFSFYGVTYSDSTWSGLYVKLCEELILRHPHNMVMMYMDPELNSPDNTKGFSFVRNEILHEPVMLSNGMWMEAGKPREEIIKLFCCLLKKCGYAEEINNIIKIDVRGT